MCLSSKSLFTTYPLLLLHPDRHSSCHRWNQWEGGWSSVGEVYPTPTGRGWTEIKLTAKLYAFSPLTCISNGLVERDSLWEPSAARSFRLMPVVHVRQLIDATVTIATRPGTPPTKGDHVIKLSWQRKRRWCALFRKQPSRWSLIRREIWMQRQREAKMARVEMEHVWAILRSWNKNYPPCKHIVIDVIKIYLSMMW